MHPREKNQRTALDVAWKAADHLRGSIDATRYKNTLLPLLYLRHLSAQAVEADGRQLPLAAQWDTLTQRISAAGSDAAAVLNEAFVELMRMHRDLTDAFAPAEALLEGLSPQQVADLFALCTANGPQRTRSPMPLARCSPSSTHALPPTKDGGEGTSTLPIVWPGC